MVYGTNLTLPGDMIEPPSAEPQLTPMEFVSQLREQMADVQPTLSRYTGRAVYIPKDLASCEYVFLRTDAVRRPLQRPYTGPYKVLGRKRYTITIQTSHGPEDVAIERVKPAHVDPQTARFDLPRPRGRPPAQSAGQPLGGSDVGSLTIANTSDRTSPVEHSNYTNTYTHDRYFYNTHYTHKY